MKKVYKKIILTITLGVTALLVNAQINPTPHILYNSDYSFTGFANGTITTFPAGMGGQRFSSDPTASTVTVARFAAILYDNASSVANYTHRNEISNGVSMSGNLNKGMGALCVALNTTLCDSVEVSFVNRQIRDQNTVSYACKLQYRVGTTGNFADVLDGGETPVVYTTLVSGMTPSQAFNNIMLPEDAWNQSVVQLRWIYYQVSGPNSTSFLRDRIAVDDISITKSTHLPRIINEQCGFTMVSGKDTIWSDSLPSTGNVYDFWIQGGNIDYVYTGRTRSYFFMTGIPASAGGVQYNTPYQVRVRVNSGAWGDVCTINTPAAIPATKVVTASCNSTVAAVNSTFLVDFVPFATGYEYHVTGTGVDAVYTRSSSTSFALSYITGYGANGPQPGRTYAVEVRAIIAGTDKNLTYGTPCNITVSSVVPDVRIRDLECNIVLTTWGKAMRTTTLPYAVNYDIQLSDMSNNVLATITDTDGIFYFTDLKAIASPALTNSTTYQLQVRARTQDLLGSYSTICTVTTPATGARMRNTSADDEIITTENTSAASQTIVYPNPSKGNFTIKTDLEGMKNMRITNINGQEVANATFEGTDFLIKDELPTGIYILHLNNTTSSEVIKLVRE